MTKTDWTAEEVRNTARQLDGLSRQMLTAFAKRIEADGSAVPTCWSLRHKDGTGALFADCMYDNEDDARNDAIALNGESGQLVPVPLFTHPPAQPAHVDVPDWRIAMFDRWREAAQEKGYAGIAEAINAVPDARQPAQEQPGWKVPETVFSEEMIREEIDYTKRFTGQKMLADFAKIVAASPIPPTTCNHEWVDARNQYVESGEVCLKCMSIRGGNTIPLKGEYHDPFFDVPSLCAQGGNAVTVIVPTPPKADGSES